MALESLADALAALEASGTNTAGSGGQGNPPPTPYNSKLASNVTFGNPNTTNHKLGTGLFNGYNTYDELTSEAISKRKFNINNLGKNDRLGEGDFTLGTLFKHNHRGAPQRGLIDTGKKDYQGNAITINTGRAGIGSLGNLDIKGYSSFARTGLLGPVAEGLFRIATLGLAGNTADAIGDFGKEPYIVRNIPKSGNGIYGGSRDTIPFRAALDDVSRLAQFYTSPAGVAFMAKENITNTLIGAKAGGVSGLIDGTFGSIMAPPVPLPLTGFLSLLGAPQKIQGAGLGTIRKPFKIRYSDRTSIGLPFGIQGDATLGIKKVIEKTKVPQDLRPIFKIPLEKLREAAINKLDSVAQVPILRRTPFLDLNTTPSQDLVNKRGPTSSDDGDTAAFVKGDFYVKIKDLRKGGSFVYFRGFVTGITENVSPSFTSTNYIGRSEPVYMYERAERDISFNLRVYPNNGPEFETMYEKIEYLTSLAYPNYQGEFDKVGIGAAAVLVENKSVLRMQPPFTELYMAHIGTPKKGQFGFIKSISYTVPGEGDWDALRALPRLFDIAISYQILNKKPPQMGDKFYGRGR
jgi:hypothetical protein